MECFFAIGYRQTGQFVRYVLDQPFPQLTRGSVGEHVILTDHLVEFLPLLKCFEKRERFRVSCYRPG